MSLIELAARKELPEKQFMDQETVEIPSDALKTFLSCEMDYLVMGDFLVEKTD